jgi:dimethylargininase
VLTAITREVNAALGSCELTFLSRTGIDADLALEQHQQYQSALSSLGCEIVSLPTEPGMADSVFIEDTAIVLDEIAVLSLEGGDLLCIDKVIYAGLSTRSNQSGIEQLRSIVADYGFSVKSVETTKCLHLKSAVSKVAPGTLLINPDWISKSAFADYELINVDKDEAHAANALLVGRSLIYSSSYPRTREKLLASGIVVVPVDVSEVQKAEGAVTCCSLVFTTP